MAVTFDPANGGKPYSREGGQSGAAVPEPRGLLDFGSVMKARGLLDAQASAVAMGDPTSTATRFDEGSLFGHATSSRREPAIGRIAAESETSSAAKSATETVKGAQQQTAQFSSAPGAAPPGSNRLAGRGAAISGRFAEPLFDTPALGANATSVADARPRAAPGRKALGGGTAYGGAPLAARARHVEALGPVHVIARNGSKGVELTVRVAGVADEQADLLERRLRKAAVEERADVSSVRLNGADRPERAGRQGNG